MNLNDGVGIEDIASLAALGFLLGFHFEENNSDEKVVPQ